MKPILLPPLPRPAVMAPRPVVIGDDVTVVQLGGGVRLDVTDPSSRTSVILTRVQTQQLAHALMQALISSRKER